MSVRFSYIGDRLLALRRRLPPVLYRLDSTSCHVQFNHAGYHNSCTMKSCSFAGSHDQVIQKHIYLVLVSVHHFKGPPLWKTATVRDRVRNSVSFIIRASLVFNMSGFILFCHHPKQVFDGLLQWRTQIFMKLCVVWTWIMFSRSTQPGHPFVDRCNEYQQKMGCNRHTTRCTSTVSMVWQWNYSLAEG